MRPVVRGARPTNSGGDEIVFQRYREARGELIERMGQYCSYCEMRLNASLAVEHVRPKKPPGAKSVLEDRELNWDNFLLGCTNCNSIKGNDDVVLEEYLWPDADNVFRALEYRRGGVVRERGQLLPALEAKARAMIELVGLERRPGKDLEASDRRWLNRREAWGEAESARERLLISVDKTAMREPIVATAKATGFWSVWMTVFGDDPIMLRMLIEAFPGTARDCFDERGVALPRPGGQC